MVDTSADAVVRPPKQDRSRQAWEAVLEAGTWILEHEGREALTVNAVCERAGVARTVIYRRVDGIAGLFWAIYDRRIQAIDAVAQERLHAAAAAPAGSPLRIERVVRAIADSWELHSAFLHQMVNYSRSDPVLDERGAREARALVDQVAELLASPTTTMNFDVARMLHQDCTIRTMYGGAWLAHTPETYEDFVARLTRIASRCLLPDGR